MIINTWINLYYNIFEKDFTINDSILSISVDIIFIYIPRIWNDVNFKNKEWNLEAHQPRSPFKV